MPADALRPLPVAMDVLRKKLENAAAVEDSAMRLGYLKSGNDYMVARLREAVRIKRLDLRSTTLVEQLAKVQWRGSTAEARTMEREPDERLKMKLSGADRRTWPGRAGMLTLPWSACTSSSRSGRSCRRGRLE